MTAMPRRIENLCVQPYCSFCCIPCDVRFIEFQSQGRQSEMPNSVTCPRASGNSGARASLPQCLRTGEPLNRSGATTKSRTRSRAASWAREMARPSNSTPSLSLLMSGHARRLPGDRGWKAPTCDHKNRIKTIDATRITNRIMTQSTDNVAPRPGASTGTAAVGPFRSWQATGPRTSRRERKT